MKEREEEAERETEKRGTQTEIEGQSMGCVGVCGVISCPGAGPAKRSSVFRLLLQPAGRSHAGQELCDSPEVPSAHGFRAPRRPGGPEVARHAQGQTMPCLETRLLASTDLASSHSSGAWVCFRGRASARRKEAWNSGAEPGRPPSWPTGHSGRAGWTDFRSASPSSS